MRTCRTVSIWGVIGILSLFGHGCSNSEKDLFPVVDPPLVWPQLPDTPRIRYVGEISGQTDLKEPASFFQGLFGWIFGSAPVAALEGPYALAMDDQEVLFVTDTYEGAVHVFDLKRRRYRQFSRVDEASVLQRPVGVALVGAQVYVVDSGLRKVVVYDPEGKNLFSFGQDRLVRPSGIAYWSQGDILCVADTGKHQIVLFDKEGRYRETIGARGLLVGQFNFPTHLWIDATGRLFISDTLNYRIQSCNLADREMRSFGAQGLNPGNFAHPCGVATDGSGNIYVVDRQFENIQVFDPEGNLLMALGQEGRKPGEFWMPAGICVDKRNRIYVADFFNSRVQIFERIRDEP